MSPNLINHSRLRSLGTAGVATLGLLGTAGVAAAHHGPPPPGSGPPAAHEAPPAPRERPAGPARPVEHPLVTLNSDVQRLLRGPRGELDGLLLADGARVRAPRHAIVRDLGDLVGRTVSARGRLKPAQLAHATVVVDGETVAAPPHERPETPDGERRVQRSGTITEVTRGPRGEANGIVLEDGTRVGVPHREVDAGRLVGRSATVTGYLKPAELHQATVTSGGATYIRDTDPARGARGARKGHRPAHARGDAPPPRRAAGPQPPHRDAGPPRP